MLLHMNGTLLRSRPTSQHDAELATFATYLDHVRDERVVLAPDLRIERALASDLNRRLGFATAGAGPGIELEVDALHDLARRSGATVPGGRTELLSGCGFGCLTDDGYRWAIAAAGILEHASFERAVVAATLLWLLDDDACAAGIAIEEAVRRYGGRIGRAARTVVFLYTTLTALQLVERSEGRPRLTETGRLFVHDALALRGAPAI